MDSSCKEDEVLHAIYLPTTNTHPSLCSELSSSHQSRQYLCLLLFCVCCKWPDGPGQLNPALSSCMRSSIPLLANTQVPVICSVCPSGLGGPLPWHGWQFSRWDVGFTPVSLHPPWARSWSFNLEEAHLRRRRNMPNSTILYCWVWHQIRMSCGDEPGIS